jgi:hypothetical protein
MVQLVLNINQSSQPSFLFLLFSKITVLSTCIQIISVYIIIQRDRNGTDDSCSDGKGVLYLVVYLRAVHVNGLLCCGLERKRKKHLLVEPLNILSETHIPLL